MKQLTWTRAPVPPAESPLPVPVPALALPMLRSIRRQGALDGFARLGFDELARDAHVASTEVLSMLAVLQALGLILVRERSLDGVTVELHPSFSETYELHGWQERRSQSDAA